MQSDHPVRVVQALEQVVTPPLETVLTRQATTDPATAAPALFQHITNTVPAYRAALAAHGIDPAWIRSVDDFLTLPPITRQNSVQRYPLAERCRDGLLSACDMPIASSGSTGTATIWPCSLTDELQ